MLQSGVASCTRLQETLAAKPGPGVVSFRNLRVVGAGRSNGGLHCLPRRIVVAHQVLTEHMIARSRRSHIMMQIACQAHVHCIANRATGDILPPNRQPRPRLTLARGQRQGYVVVCAPVVTLMPSKARSPLPSSGLSALTHSSAAGSTKLP